MGVLTDKNIHTSVLLNELVHAIEIHSGKQNIIVDCTLGLAGHASQVIQKMNPDDIFVGFDADERNLTLARKNLERLKTKIKIVLIHSNFESLKEKLLEHNIYHVTGIYYDLGVSSMHFD